MQKQTWYWIFLCKCCFSGLFHGQLAVTFGILVGGVQEKGSHWHRCCCTAVASWKGGWDSAPVGQEAKVPELTLWINSFVRITSFTFAMYMLRAKRIHGRFRLPQPHGCSSTCPNFSEFHMHFKTVSYSRWYFHLVVFLLAKETFPLPLAWELEGSARAQCLCESRHELIRLALQWAVIYEASPFLTFPLFMQGNFNVINTKRFTAGRRELPSFISAIKLLVPTVAFPFDCLLGWNPGF